MKGWAVTSKWTDNEEGPECDCGNPTVVKLSPGGPVLLCFFHTDEEGLARSLTAEKPEGWPKVEAFQ